jgi:hypothetical protein
LASCLFALQKTGMFKSINKFVLKIIVIIFYSLILSANLSAQGKIVASLDFDPKVAGFSFPNYKTVKTGDIGTEDLIRMFGVKATCKSGNNTKNCVLKAAAQKWIEKMLEAMEIGHCEGIGVASLRLKTGLRFKDRWQPSQFQNGAKTPFGLQLLPSIENYISYYWVTQTFDEVTLQTKETAKLGPKGIAEKLISAMNNQKDTFLLGIKKYEKGRIFDGHAVVPFAVEDIGNQYKIHVYDNNFPGETRFLFINKATRQWFYNSTKNLNAKPDYVGDFSTKTLELTATSWREGVCFDASFANDEDKETGCGIETATLSKPNFINASFHQNLSDDDGEDAEFFLTGEGDMLVVEDGKRIGFDPRNNRYYNDDDEIKDGNSTLLVGGFSEDLQHFTMPYQESDEPYKIIFSGRNLDEESNLDFVFSAPGFTVGFDGIRLDPDETLTAEVSHNGEVITFTASADAETPEVYFAFDSDDDADASYITTIGGVELTAKKALTYDFDFENGKLFFSDDDGNEDNYDIDLIRINADGSRQEYKQNDLDMGKADKYEMDFGDWDGKNSMCFKDDEDKDGFDDEECTEESNEKP